MSSLKEVSATGDVVTGADGYRLHSVVLTAAGATSSVVIRDTSGGSALLTVKAAANTTARWEAGDRSGVFVGTTIHATLSGASAVADVEYA